MRSNAVDEVSFGGKPRPVLDVDVLTDAEPMQIVDERVRNLVIVKTPLFFFQSLDRFQPNARCRLDTVLEQLVSELEKPKAGSAGR